MKTSFVQVSVVAAAGFVGHWIVEEVPSEAEKADQLVELSTSAAATNTNTNSSHSIFAFGSVCIVIS